VIIQGGKEKRMAPRAKKIAAAVRTVDAPEAMQRIALLGSLDRVDPDGTIEGWCFSPDEPQARRHIAILIDGAEVARVTADRVRPDLAAAGVGDGGHAFAHRLDSALMRADTIAEVVLRDIGTGQVIGTPVSVRWQAPAPHAAPATDAMPQLAGSLDRISRDGWVSGWCWYPERSEAHVELVVLVDGEPVGTVLADDFRPDLQQAGIGDGTHGFNFALPYTVLTERGTLTVTVQESGTGRALGDPITMRIGRMAAAEERIQELERQVRLLRSQLEELQRFAAARHEERAARDLFATVAAFFQDLAEGGAGAAEGTRLAGALAEVTARYAPLTLARPERVCATLCLAATAGFESVYRCLAALHDAGIDAAAEIVVLDDGRADAANALLPTVVRNLRYEFVGGPQSLAEARNAVAASARGELLVWLAPAARLAGGWLDEIAETFAAWPEAAAVGGRLLREDGLLHASALRLGPDGMLRDAAHLAPGERPEWRALRRVDALAGGAFAVRREDFLVAGGFSALYRRLGHATVDLCARLRASGREVLQQPLATALWIEPAGGSTEADAPDFGLADEETLRLRERVLGRGWPAASTMEIGRALVIDDHLPRPDHDAGSVATLEQMKLLRRLGWYVTFAPAHGQPPAPEAADALARQGIVVAAPPHVPSVTEYLQQEGQRLDLVHIYRYANMDLLAGRVRELAPQARLVFATADLHHLREERRAHLAGRAAPKAVRAAELRAIRAADATILTNDHEQALLAKTQEAKNARLVLLRWIARPTPPTRGFAERQGICFLGNFRHPPNIDGVEWFAAEVLPLVRRELPDLRLLLAGADMPASIRALEGEGVEVLGWVPDLAALFGRVRLSVAPLRFGAGFKGKVATSLAHGLPVVGSSVSLEGTGLVPGDGVAVADTPEAFVREIVRLHEDRALWEEQSARALERVAALYSPETALAVWRDLLHQMDLPVGG
jgi:hypothetical protein